MRWTNRYSIDPLIAAAITQEDNTEDTGDFRITELVRPPQMVALERLHAEEITVDVSDGLWLLLGRAIHAVLAQQQHSQAMQETRLSIVVDGYVVTGKPDVLWLPPATLKDYKVTSVFSLLLGEKADWTAQINMYAVLLRENGFPVEKAFIAAILRDWTKSHQGETDYPEIAFMEVPVALWPHEDALAYLRERVRLHARAKEDGIWPPCTDEERWVRPPTWALKRAGQRKAVRVFRSEAPAVKAGEQNPQLFIEARPGRNVRCESYCRAAPFCPQFNQSRSR